MRIIGCDLHAREQTIAMLDTDMGEQQEKTLEHQGETVREFYSALSGPILVGVEATGSMRWYAGIDGRVGDRMPSRSSPEDPQGGDVEAKHDRRDARLLLTLLKSKNL